MDLMELLDEYGIHSLEELESNLKLLNVIKHRIYFEADFITTTIKMHPIEQEKIVEEDKEYYMPAVEYNIVKDYFLKKGIDKEKEAIEKRDVEFEKKVKESNKNLAYYLRERRKINGK